MKRFLKSLLVGLALIALVPSAFGQQVVVTSPISRASNNSSGTIASTSTFQSVFAQSSARAGCLIQNNGANAMDVFFGPIASATVAKSVVLGLGQSLNCATSGVSATDQVSISGTSGDAFLAIADGAPAVNAPSTVATTAAAGGATSANQTNGSQKTQIVDGSGNVAGTQSFAGSANFLNVTTPDELPFSGTASSAIVIPVSINSGATQAFIDMSGYESISVQVTSAGVATTLTYETSDDNTNWLTSPVLLVNGGGTTAASTTSTIASAYLAPKRLRYFRVRVSTYGSGTVTIVGNLHKNPQPLTNRITVDGPQTNGGGISATGIFPPAFRAATSYSATANGNAIIPVATLVGVSVVKPYAIPEADWQTAVSLSTTGSTALQAAGGAGVKNYLTAIQFSGNAALVANTIQILSGASVIWGPHTIAAATAFTQITFPTPLQTGAATALNVQIGTTPVGALEVTAQGYAAAD